MVARFVQKYLSLTSFHVLGLYSSRPAHTPLTTIRLIIHHVTEAAVRAASPAVLSRASTVGRSVLSGLRAAYMHYLPKHEFRAGGSMHDRIEYSLPEPRQSRL